MMAYSRGPHAGAWAPWLCQASAWRVMCPGVSGIWVHGWICSNVDGCRWGLWACQCNSLELLHRSCWVVPLGLSSALLWGGYSSPSGGPPGVPVLWGPLDVCR
ncbi:hypothetical protein ILYODFUR_013115 [Ilyodon furcidens]|uniref:Secreted protein n=1 Tax=Ilyodon furcidens TaxID=33524 RepID=A0ABV0TLX6_9TELE